MDYHKVIKLQSIPHSNWWNLHDGLRHEPSKAEIILRVIIVQGILKFFLIWTLATLSLSLFSKLIDSILADYPIFLLKVLFLLLILTEYFVEPENEREEVK